MKFFVHPTCVMLLAAALAAQPAIVPNLGQLDTGAAACLTTRGVECRFLSDGFELWIQRAALADRLPIGALANARPAAGSSAGVAVVRMRLRGAAPMAPRGVERLPGVQHYLLGSDQSRWLRDVPRYGGLVYDGILPSTALKIGAERTRAAGGLFEYDFIVRAGSVSAPEIVLDVEGAALRVDSDGSVVMTTDLGELRQTPPRSWTEFGSVPSRCERRGVTSFALVADWNGRGTLTIDPGLVWAGYEGGTVADELCQGLAVLPDGSCVVGGDTTQQAFVTKYSADGSTVSWTAWIGGSGQETLWGVAADPVTGEVTLGGRTNSANFPVVNGQARTGGFDAYVVRLSANGSTILWSTCFGGSVGEGVQAFAVDANGTTTFGGWTASTDLPCTANALQAAPGGVSQGVYDGFVCQLSPTGARVYSTYIGGATNDYVSELAVSGGVITMTLGTQSADLTPYVTANAYQAAHGGGGAGSPSGDVFILRIQPAATATVLLYGSYFGGANNEWPFGCHVDSNGVVTFAGGGGSVPTTLGAWRRTPGGGTDAYVARLDPRLPPAGQLLYCTYVGGSGYDNGYRLHVDAAGIASVVGVTNSTDLVPTPGAWQTTFQGGSGTQPYDGFLARVDNTGQQLEYESYVGGPGGDGTANVHVGADRLATVVGFAGPGFPTTLGAAFGGGTMDGLVTRLVLPGGIGVFGKSCGLAGAKIAADPAFLPRVGLPFVLRLRNLAPSMTGVGLLGFARLAAPLGLGTLGMTGCTLDITPTVDLPLVSNASGTGTFALGVPANPALSTLEFFVQAVMPEPGANALGWITTHTAVGVIR